MMNGNSVSPGGRYRDKSRKAASPASVTGRVLVWWSWDCPLYHGVASRSPMCNRERKLLVTCNSMGDCPSSPNVLSR